MDTTTLEYYGAEFDAPGPCIILKYTCVRCGELVDDTHGLPKYCPGCGRRIIKKGVDKYERR